VTSPSSRPSNRDLREPRLRVVWAALALSLAGGYAALLLRQWRHGESILACALLFLLGAAALLYLTWNVTAFLRRLFAFVRQLLAGNYEVGIPVRRHARDQTARLEKLLNRLAEQLRIYDRLRAERVRISHRALDTLFQSVWQGVILAEVEKQVLRFNPVMQLQYGVEQSTLTFAALENIEANKGFFDLLRGVIEKEKVARDGEVTLQLPTRNVSLSLYVRAVPLKDIDDEVKLVFLLVLTPDPVSAPPPAAPAATSG
jgi:hypothetical protein